MREIIERPMMIMWLKFDGTLTCRASPYPESDASDSEADANKNLIIIFWKSSLILLVKPTSIRQIFGSSNLKE